MGSEEVDWIVSKCPEDRQTLLFSATFPPSVVALSKRTQKSPQFVQVEATDETGQIQQAAYRTTPDERLGLIARILAAYQPERAIVFCHLREDVNYVTEQLWKRGASVIGMHGGLEQRDREEALLELYMQSVRVLVATDVVARGLDIPS